MTRPALIPWPGGLAARGADRRSRRIGHALASLLGGCAPLAAVLDPPLAQLARWEGAAPERIAAEAVRCPPGHPACARLHGRRAEACMSLAMGSRAPGAACPGSDAHLRCAMEGYAAANALAPSPSLALGEGQAALCLAAFVSPREGAALAKRATETPLQLSRAALLAARPGAGTDEARCAAARAALRVAPPASREASDLAGRIATIPHCPGDSR
jgi:hypothetical protein